MTEQVLVALEQGVQILTLNRPSKKNALTEEMYGALADGLERADRDPAIRVTLITATSGAFTAGNDMGDFAKAGSTPVENTAAEPSHVARFIQGLREVEKPIVAAVNGLSVGIGVTMLLHCDLVYAAASATFQMPFVKLGLVPEAGSTLLLPRLIGLQKAADLFLTSKKIDARTAEALGLVAEVFADHALPAEALARAQALAAQCRQDRQGAAEARGPRSCRGPGRRREHPFRLPAANRRSEGSRQRLPGKAPRRFFEGRLGAKRFAATARPNPRARWRRPPRGSHRSIRRPRP